MILYFMSEKLRSADALEMGRQAYGCQFCILWNIAISMSLVSHSFSYMDISSFACLKGADNTFFTLC